jgi:hypothetical protein
MKYTIFTNNISEFECDDLKAGMMEIAEFVVERETLEPVITEIECDGKSMSQRELLAFENELLEIIQEERRDDKEREIHHRRYGYA